ncbi:MAG: glycoside hydrolase family 99-like domain-containing protein [Herpetosiphonaceae bacterium]|nr:glycoside hydrolase family 99-like domain-containing protein [Herpetosiphonaceae bacterium]
MFFRRILVLTVALLALILVVPQHTIHAATNKPILAFYFPWYEDSDWTSGKMSDLPAQLYNGGDQTVLERHLAQASNSGITGFICSWFGPNEPRLTDRCDRLLKATNGSTFTITISPDQAADFTGTLRTPEGMATALQFMRDHWMSSPNWPHIDGRPVVLFWNPQSFGSVAIWRTLQQAVDPGHTWYWVGEGVDFNYLDVFDAQYFFDITWAAEPASAMASYSNHLAAYNTAHNTSKPFVATVMAGYDDRLVRNGHVRDRANGDYYRQAWQTAIDRNARFVIINSWNEWYEGTQIEPSRTYGTQYLDLTHDYAQRFLNNGSAPPIPVGSYTFPQTGQTVSGRLLDYWQHNGGLSVFGLPLDAQAPGQTPDGLFQAQLFERNRLELHPENARPYDVLLGRLGADTLSSQGRPWETLPKEQPKAGCRFFPQTGHNLCEPFLSYWRSHGLDLGQPGITDQEALALFGMPISGVSNERNSSGDTVPTQWFERARFEHHTENPPPYDILLGRLGAESR